MTALAPAIWGTTYLATSELLQPLLVVALSGRLLGELVAPRVVIAGVAGVAGVGLLVLRGGTPLDAIGVAAGLGAAAVMATGIVLSKRWPSPAPLLATTGGAAEPRRRDRARLDRARRATHAAELVTTRARRPALPAPSNTEAIT